VTHLLKECVGKGSVNELPDVRSLDTACCTAYVWLLRACPFIADCLCSVCVCAAAFTAAASTAAAAPVAAAGFYVRIVATDPANPVRNISIVPVAAEANFLAKPYQQGFVDLVKGGSNTMFFSVSVPIAVLLVSPLVSPLGAAGLTPRPVYTCVYACAAHSVHKHAGNEINRAVASTPGLVFCMFTCACVQASRCCASPCGSASGVMPTTRR
jgi:hypothetical protein